MRSQLRLLIEYLCCANGTCGAFSLFPIWIEPQFSIVLHHEVLWQSIVASSPEPSNIGTRRLWNAWSSVRHPGSDLLSWCLFPVDALMLTWMNSPSLHGGNVDFLLLKNRILLLAFDTSALNDSLYSCTSSTTRIASLHRCLPVVIHTDFFSVWPS